MRVRRPVFAALLVTALLALASTSAGAIAARSVTLDFDQLPGGEWVHETCAASSTHVSGGILTIDALGCVDEFLDRHGSGSLWHESVDNHRGWEIEVRLRVDPATTSGCGGLFDAPIIIWINDHTRVTNIGFGPSAVCLSYPDFVSVPMDTTDAFHVYRIEGKHNRIRVFVDGRKVIDHRLSVVGAGSDVLMFGNADPSTPAVSHWDYFRYTVRPTH